MKFYDEHIIIIRTVNDVLALHFREECFKWIFLSIYYLYVFLNLDSMTAQLAADISSFLSWKRLLNT